jgi:hypothetical protein
MLRHGCSALALLLCLGSNPLRADFVISFDPNTTIAPGSSGFVNVYISSTTPGGQTLSQTSFELALTPTSPTRLAFQDSPLPESDPTYSDPNYVFFGTSVNQTQTGNSFFRLGTARNGNSTNDHWAGGDMSFLFGLVGATPQLIGKVPVTTLTGSPPTPGSTFTISLVPTSGVGLSGDTAFYDGIGVPQPFTSGTGTITVSSSPEPSALILVGTGVGLSWLVGRRRGRAPQTTP